MGIVRFALRVPYTFYALAALILFLGASTIAITPIDIFPQINIPVVSVIWQYTGLSTPEMEQRVTTCSQYSMSSSVNGIKNMEAQTLNGISVQKIYFQPDVNLDLAISQIVSATDSVRAVMPAGHQFPAALYAPLPVALFEDEQGRGSFEYDRPSSFFSQYGDEGVTEVGRYLDASLGAVLRKAAELRPWSRISEKGICYV